MRFGLIARADHRGLANITDEVARHLHPARTLIVTLGDLSPYENHPERYQGDVRSVGLQDPDAEVDAALAWLMAGSDVIYTAETIYFYRAFDAARALGKRTVCHVMGELFRHNQEPHLPKPDHFWLPTTWRAENVGHDATLVPIPVALDRLKPRLRTEARTFLHNAGHPAMGDRNGTQLLCAALPLIRSEVTVIIASQKPLGLPGRLPPNLTIDTRIGDREDYWSIYDEADVLVSPRRYGGLSLPMNEAAGAGMPMITLGVEPQRSLFAGQVFVPGVAHGRIRSQDGPITSYSCMAQDLADAIDGLAQDPAAVRVHSERALAWGRAYSWEALAPVWEKALEAACV